MQLNRYPRAAATEQAVELASACVPGVLPRDFAGRWQVRRTVADHVNRQHHEFIGSAIITATSFSESGELQIDAAALEASRTYDLIMDDCGVIVCFSSGREFVRLSVATRQLVHHYCGEDIYRGRFLFRNADSWAEFWRVSGPRKRYSSLTRYQRVL